MFFTRSIEDADFIQHFTHEALAAKAGDNAHYQYHIELAQVGQHFLNRGGRIDSQPRVGSSLTNSGQSGMQVDMPLALNVNSNHVHACLNETWKVVVGGINHEVGVQIGIGGNAVANSCTNVRPKGNVVDKRTIHHIQVQPVSPGGKGAGGFFSDAAEITSKH